MDGSELPDDGEGNGKDNTALIVGCAHLGALVVAGWLIRRFCRWSSDADDETAEDEDDGAPPKVDAKHLEPEKSVSTAYFLWAYLGIVGAHHFYLDRIVHGLAATWSLNFLGCGWMIDFYLVPYYCRSFNSSRCAPQAPHDRSCRRLWCRLVMVVVGYLVLTFGIIFGVPELCDRLGFVDLARAAAQTDANPYDILGLSKGDGLGEAKRAYKQMSLRWHPDKNPGCGRPCDGSISPCGKECDDKMADISKAFDAIKKRQAPPPTDRSWEGWIKDMSQRLGNDWMLVVQNLDKVFQEKETKPIPKGKAGSRSRPRPDRPA